MDWLLSNGKAIDLATDIGELIKIASFGEDFSDTVGDIDARLDAIKAALSADGVLGQVEDIKEEIDKTANALDLVGFIALEDIIWNKLDDILDALRDLGIDHGDARALLQTTRDTLGQIPDKYYKLLRHVDAFAETKAGEDPGLVAWAASKTLSGSPNVAEGVALSLSASGSAALQLEAGHLYPHPKADSRYLRIGVRGEVDAKASASVPLNIGTIKAGAGAGGKLSADYMIAPSTDAGTFALEAAAGFKVLTNPFALGGLYPAMQSGPLHAVTVSASGQSYLNTSIGLSKSIDIAKLANIQAGVTVDAEIRISGEYRVEARNLSEQGIHVAVVSSPSQTQSIGIGLGVVINASGLAEKIKEELTPHLTELKGKFDKLDDFLQPGKLLRNEIDEQVIQQLDDDNLAILAQLAVGRANKADAAKKLGDAMQGYLDSQSSAWEGDISGASQAGITWLIERYPALDNPKVKDKLQSTLKKAIQLGREKLKDEVNGLAANTLDGLLDTLEQGGVKIANVANKADAALAGLRKALQNYRQTVENLLKRAEELATADLNIQIHSSSSSTVGSSVEAAATITANTAVTRKAYSALLSGDMDKILALVDAPVTGFDLQLGTWQRFAEFKQSGGFSVILLDLKLTQSTVFSSEARVQVDDKGALSVMSKADWKKERAFRNESKQFQFTSVYSLLAARHSRSFSSSMQLTYSDEETDASDVLEFFGHLIEFGLIDPNTVSSAARLLQEAESQDSDAALAGAISVKLALTTPALERLIGAGGHGPTIDKKTCADFTLRALRSTGAMTDDDISYGYNGIRGSAGASSDITPVELLLKLNNQLRRRALRNYAGREKTTHAIEQWARARERSDKLLKMIKGMKSVYTAQPQRQNAANDKLERWYKDNQKPINAALKAWISFDGSLLDLVRAEVSAETLAFLLIINDLAQPGGGDGFPLRGFLKLNEQNREVPLP